MSALSLGKTNGGTRALTKKKHAPAGPVASFIPAPPSSPEGPAFEESTNSNILTEKTESICSDDPAPPSSEIFIPAVPAVPKFDLEETYPSIFVPINLLRLVEGVKDLDRLRSLAQVFATCLQTIIHSMDTLPYDIRLNPTYELAKYGVVFTGGLFAAQVAKIDSDWYAAQVAEGMEMALELMDITIASLRNFLEVAERILVENKPLPALPSEDSAEPLRAKAESAPGTLANIVAEVLQSPESTPVTPSLEPVYTSKRKPANNPARKASSQRKGSIIRRILQRTPKASNASTLPSETESFLTLVGPEFGTTPIVEPSKSLAESAPPKPSYILRQSAVYFPADPYCPEVDVEMPLPAGDTVAVRLDHLGAYKAASLTALVRMLTSKDAVTDLEFTDTFFMCFRMFSSPMQFFELLIKRFDEQPPASLTTVQLRVWTREMMHVRIRVAKTIRIWLTEYWRPEFDSEVLEHLQAFALDRIVGDLPDQLAMRILEGLNDLVNGKEHRGVKRQKQLEIVKYSAMVEEPKPTGFLLVPKSTPQLSQFESKAGREELARQLTIKASEIFFKIDPAEVVIFWKKKNDKGVGPKVQATNSFEKSLGLWVTSTILDQLTERRRVDLIEFWFDISTVSSNNPYIWSCDLSRRCVSQICVRLRNFSCAHAIYLGVANPAVGRLKHTVLVGLLST